jgi:hypothetical protein
MNECSRIKRYAVAKNPDRKKQNKQIAVHLRMNKEEEIKVSRPYSTG